MQAEKNIWLKVLSLILTLALLISCVPNQVYAMASEALADLLEQEEAVLHPDTTTDLELSTARIVAEDASRRGEFYKEYIMNNGLRYATVYPSAIHYEDNGQWKDIDNTLVAAISGGKSVYQNKAGAWNVRFPQSLSGSDMIGITKDGHTVQFGMAGELRSSGDLVVASIGQIGSENAAATLAVSSAQTATAQIQEIDLTAARAAAEHPETILDKLNSRLTYANVYPNTNVVYDLQGNQLKESVVMQSYDASLWGYRYTLDTGDLVPVLREDQQIDLCHPETNEVILTMPAPYMLDNNGEISYDVEVMLTRNGSSYLLSYYLPREWLANTDRAWPVILDPVVTGNSRYTNVKDVTVAETGTESSTRGVIQCGYLVGSGAMRMYMQYINLPIIPSGNVIVDATISLIKPMNYATASNVEVYKVTETWTSSTITWANKAAYEEEIVDYVVCQNAGTYTWNITSIVQDWYETGNYGMMFKTPSEVETGGVNNWKQFYSSDFSNSADTLPELTITYQPVVYDVTLSHESATMYKGDTLTLTATTTPAGQAVSWLSSDSTVASVSETGVVTALSDGNATITATLADGATATCEIEVVEKTIAFTSSNVNVYIGKPTILHVRTTPDGEPVQWTSLNPSIATVTNGIVTGINIGQATIRAEIGNGASAECIVNVSSMSISLDYTNIEIYAGDPFTLKATVIPPEQEVAWESDDENIAIVSDGVVTGKGAGQTIIRAVIDEEIYAECTVTVLSKSITLNYQNVYLLKGESFTLRATTVPEGANVTWKSDDNNIATVVNGYVTCKNAGQTVIRAIINETTYATCTVNISPSQLSLNRLSTSVAVGDFTMLVATVKPSHLSVTWTSSDETVATVSSSGVVRGHKIGDVVITASLADGTSVNCTVKVRCVGTLNYSSQNIVEGNSFYLTLSTETPIDIVWQSSDTHIATVDAQGRVFAMNPGVVEITANSSSLLEPVSCTVNVRLMESIYVIKNLGSNLWLTAKDYGIFPDTLVVQEENQSDVNIAASLSQYWKICYLGNRYYSIRPAHKLNLCLFATDDGQIILTDLNTDTDSDALPTGAQWSITVTPTGYILKSQAHLNNPIMPQGASEDPGMQVICGTQSGSGDASLWSIYGVTVAPRVLLYDATTGEHLETTRVGVVYDEYTSIADMNIAISVVRNTGLYQGITWTCSDPDAVYFYGDGSIVGQKCGKVTVTATPYGSSNSISATYTLVISKIKTYGDELEYEAHRWNTDYIQLRTNCYAYALNNQIDPNGNNFGCNYSVPNYPNVIIKQAPGDFHNSNLSPNESKVNFTGYGKNHCLLIDAVAADFEKYNEIFGTNLIFRVARRDERCPDGTYKVALFIDITTDSQGADFHWFRQDSDGMWSHKPASDPVTRLDYDYNPIYDIEEADTGVYTEFVGYFIVSAWNHMYLDQTMSTTEMPNNTPYFEPPADLIVHSDTFSFGHQLLGTYSFEQYKAYNNVSSRVAASSIRRKVYEKTK